MPRFSDVRPVEHLTKAQLVAVIGRRLTVTGTETKADLLRVAYQIGIMEVDVARPPRN